MNRIVLALSILVLPALAADASARPRVPSVPVAPAAPHSAAVPAAPQAPAAPAAPAAIAFPAAIAPPAPPSPPGFSFSFSTGQGRLGAHVSSMTPELRDFFGAPADAGILVQKVLPGTAAEDAGLRVGDVVIRVDGDDVTELGDVAEALSDRKKGDAVAIEVVRKRKTTTLSATLREAPKKTWSRSWSSHSGGGSGFPSFAPFDQDVQRQLEAIEQRLEALEASGSRKLKRKPAKKAKPKKKARPAKKAKPSP